MELLRIDFELLGSELWNFTDKINYIFFIWIVTKWNIMPWRNLFVGRISEKDTIVLRLRSAFKYGGIGATKKKKR